MTSESSRTKDDAKRDILTVLPYLRLAIEEALKRGKPELAVSARHDDGGGQVVCTFTPEIIEDIALLIDAPPMSQEDRMRAQTKMVGDWLLKNLKDALATPH